jgi:hypothetical protein
MPAARAANVTVPAGSNALGADSGLIVRPSGCHVPVNCPVLL